MLAPFAWLAVLFLQGEAAPVAPPAPPAAKSAPKAEAAQDPAKKASAPAAKSANDPKPAKDAKDPGAKDKKSAPSTKKKSVKQGAPAEVAKKPAVIPTPRPRPPETPSYKVSLRMKTGRRFVGIVSRDKKFHELVHAGAHHSAPAYKRADRFMLRFVDGLDGDVELSWNQIAKLEVRDVLDSAGLRAMEDDYAGMRLVRQEHQRESEAVPDEATAGEGDPTAGAGESQADGKVEGEAKGRKTPADGEKDPVTKDDAKDGEPKTADAKKDEPKEGDEKEDIPLITDFSPRAGWTPERKKQIEWRRTVVGIFPDAREERFLEVYSEWEPLYEEWMKAEVERQEEEAKAKGESKPRGESRPRNDRADRADRADKGDNKGG